MVGVSRQTLCMLLGRLQERGQIDVGYKRIRVL
jgi:predicted transcriptional regulator of viral defense system